MKMEEEKQINKKRDSKSFRKIRLVSMVGGPLLILSSFLYASHISKNHPKFYLDYGRMCISLRDLKQTLDYKEREPTRLKISYENPRVDDNLNKLYEEETNLIQLLESKRSHYLTDSTEEVKKDIEKIEKTEKFKDYYKKMRKYGGTTMGTFCGGIVAFALGFAAFFNNSKSKQKK